MENGFSFDSAVITENGGKVVVEYAGGVRVEIPASYSMAAHLIYAANNNEKNVAELLSTYIFSSIAIVPDSEMYNSFLGMVDSYQRRNIKETTDEESDDALNQIRAEFEMFSEIAGNEK